MADRLPGFLFDVENWFGSVATQRMSFAEKGVYLVMLFQQWREGAKTLPDDVNAVADLICVTEAQRAEVVAAWPEVRKKFVSDRRAPTQMLNLRLERTRRKQRAMLLKRSKAGSIGGKVTARKRLEDIEKVEQQCLSSAAASPSDKKEERGGVGIDQKERRSLPPAPASARSKRPIFTGRRLTVFEWMLDDLDRMLGPHTEGFDLHDWFFTLDEQCIARGVVIPDRDGGAWLKAETLKEAQRRGLPLVVAAPMQVGKQTSRLAAAIANIAREAS